MYKIASEEGVRALFAGLTASILGISHALIYFPLYEKTKLYFRNNFEKKNSEKLSSKYIFMSAIFSKFISSALTYPHEVLRAR
jgi:solute carrier family 25 folate transporter 32